MNQNSLIFFILDVLVYDNIYQPIFASNNRPHSEYMSKFYQTCMNDMKTLLQIKSDNVSVIYSNFSTNRLYRIYYCVKSRKNFSELM